MSTFPTPATATIRTATIPGALLELTQRAILAQASAPQDFAASLTISQSIASISLRVPAKTIVVNGAPMLGTIHRYSDTEITDTTKIPAAWGLNFVNTAGAVTPAFYGQALISVGQALKDAERLIDVPKNEGITMINHDDALQIWTLKANLPAAFTVDSTGKVFAVANDYVTATWASVTSFP